MTIAPNWDRVQGDANDTLTARCDGVADLTGVTAIEAHISDPRSSAVATTLTATVLDATERTVIVNLGSWLATATPGVWNLELQATWSGAPKTFPAGKPATVTVRRQLA